MLCGSLLLCEVLAYATITYGLQDVAPYLVGAIAASGIGMLKLGEALAQHLGPRDPAELFDPTLH